MKIFGYFLGVALLIGAGLTFFVLPEKEKTIDPVRPQYAPVFAEFAENAAEAYRQHNAYGLELLQNHRLEGLRVLKQFGPVVTALQPYLDAETVFAVCQEQGAPIAALLQQFQPAVIAEAQKRFGNDGLRYIAADPEVYFLLRQYGDRLVQLANAKGPLVFALVKRQPPEFLELYYDDGFFEALSRFGAEGLLAVKTYRGLALTLFELFAEDAQFEAVLRQYGYQQVLPILDYFYQQPAAAATLKDAFLKFEAYKLFQPKNEVPATAPPAGAQKQFERARWALSQIYERGHTFLRQFEIAANGTVRPVQLAAVTNLLEDLLIGDLRGQMPLAPKEGSGLGCEPLRAALDLLGLLPYETIVSQQARCLYLQSGLAAATTVAGIAGLSTLDRQADLVTRYGDAVLPFVAQYGKAGIELLQQTDGRILRFTERYGAEFVHVVSKYGLDVLDLVDQFGDPLVAAIHKTDGAVIAAVRKYAQETVKVLAQPEGKDLLTLVSVFGAEILPYLARYPDDFPRYLRKYGAVAVKALREHEELAVAAARKYGDEMISYLGLYGNEAARMIETGRIGVTLLSVTPTGSDAQQGQPLLQGGLPGASWRLLTSHPRQFNTSLGLLGAATLALAPYWCQLLFWTLAALVGLSALRLIFEISKLIFSI